MAKATYPQRKRLVPKAVVRKQCAAMPSPKRQAKQFDRSTRAGFKAQRKAAR